MTEEHGFDAVVLGGGLAGMAAANRLAQSGLRTAVLEQGSEEHYLCNSRYTGGVFHTCLRDIMSDENTLRQAIVDATAGFVTDTLAAVIAADGRRAVRWLQDEGVRFMKADVADHRSWMLAPPVIKAPGLNWPGRGGDVLLRTLEANLVKRGGMLVRNTRGRVLLMEENRCSGVIAQQAELEIRFRARAVVIADGGFPGNPEMIKQYICNQPERLKPRNARTARGDGLQMAIAAGADTIGLNRFYGHVLSRDAMTNDKLWPQPYLDALVTAAIVVDPSGARFVDEGRGGVYAVNAIAQLADPLSAAIIFDLAIWDGPGRNGLVPANPHLPDAGGTLLSAADLPELARKLGMEPGRLLDTVTRYNNALASGTLASLKPALRTSPQRARPIAVAPFYAAPVCAGITTTMGGIKINEHAQALRVDDTPIAGLYAAGGAAGGLEGGPEIGYVGGLVKCGVTALRAAEHIVNSGSNREKTS